MIVTSLILQPDAKTTHGVDKYVKNFRYLESTGLPITCFLDTSLVGQIDFGSNVQVRPTSLFDLPTYGFWKTRHELPTVRSASKDTLEYLSIVNMKTFWLEDLVREGYARATWVDFGLGHVCKNPEHSFKHLSRLPYLGRGIHAVSGRIDLTEGLDDVAWRYYGGIISADKSIIEFNKLLWREYERCFPKVSWEGNYWARIEKLRGANITPYYAFSFGDAILSIPTLH